MKKMILMVVFVAITFTAIATDVVTLKGNKNRVSMLAEVLKYAAEHKNCDAVFETVVTKGDVVPNSTANTWTEVYLNGSYFGKVQVSNNMYMKVYNTCFVETSDVQRHLIIDQFCAKQSAFLRSLINALSIQREYVQPKPQQITKVVYIDRVDTIYKTKTVVKKVKQELDPCKNAALQWQNIQALYDAKQISRREAKIQFTYLKQSFPECVSYLKPHWRNTGLKVAAGVGLFGAGVLTGVMVKKNKRSSSVNTEKIDFQKPVAASGNVKYQKPRSAKSKTFGNF